MRIVWLFAVMGAIGIGFALYPAVAGAIRDYRRERSYARARWRRKWTQI